MTKHTQGPWHCKSKPAQRYPVVFSGETKVARAITSKLSEHEIEANINLISAAPDMLAALHNLHVWLVDKGIDADLPEGMNDSINALFEKITINKAKGE